MFLVRVTSKIVVEDLVDKASLQIAILFLWREWDLNIDIHLNLNPLL